MTHDIVGEWDLTEVAKGAKGKDSHLGRIAFLEQGGKVVVMNADPEAADKPARVEIDGNTIRFEILSGRSGRGNTNHAYEITLRGHRAFDGTRRQGLLSKTPIIGQRVGDAPAVAPVEAPAAVAPSYATGDLSASLIAMPGSVAEAKAKAAEAAERAALAAAEAAAAYAEADAAAALEAARRAAENAAAARAAVHIQAPIPAPPAPAVQPPVMAPYSDGSVPPAVLANLPAPTQPAQPSAIVPPVAPMEYAPTATGAFPAAPVPFSPTSAFDAAFEDAAAGTPGKRQVRITHSLSREGRSTLAAELFPGVFVWGDSFVTTELRLREVGWVLTPIATDATIEVDDLLIEHAAMVRDSFAR